MFVRKIFLKGYRIERPWLVPKGHDRADFWIAIMFLYVTSGLYTVYCFLVCTESI